MSRRIKPGTRPVAGIVLVDKPAGATSNRVLQQVKALFKAQKAGHTGTLDPLATGMLPVCLGTATRVSGLMLNASKTYVVTAQFGAGTDTGDVTGTVTESDDCSPLSHDAIEAAVAGLRGIIQQVPPMYSALKQDGKRLYELARAGIEVERKPRQVEIHSLSIESLSWPAIELRVHCSKGTYVRTLVTDLAAKLGTFAHVTALRRLGVGPYDASGMVTPAELEVEAALGLDVLDQRLISIDTALVAYPSLQLSGLDAEALRQGRRVPGISGAMEQVYRIYGAGQEFIGLAEIVDSGELKPKQIFSR